MALRNSMEIKNNNAQTAIRIALVRNRINAKDIEKRNIMSANTFYKKQQYPDRLRLSDLWRLDSVLNFSDEEILRLFGR